MDHDRGPDPGSVDALVTASDRVGWRGNTAAWVARARVVIRQAVAAGDATTLEALGPYLDDWSLLEVPVLGCLVSLGGSSRGGWSALWADVRHVTLCGRPPRGARGRKGVTDDTWLAALVCVVRRRPRMTPAYARTLRCPPGMLRRALRRETWLPGDPGRWWTRTVAVLMVADRSADATDRDQARRWLAQRPRGHHTASTLAMSTVAEPGAEPPARATPVCGFTGLDPSLTFFEEEGAGASPPERWVR